MGSRNRSVRDRKEMLEAAVSETSIDHKLGIVIGQLGGIEDRLASQDESRERLYGRVNDIHDRVSKIEGDIGPIRNDLNDAKAVTDDVKRWRTMGVGALAVTGMGAAAIGSFVTAYWTKIVAAITG